MKTVGQQLKDARNKKKFSLEDAHKFIKIHPKFLGALEEGDYSAFSNKIHAKGFLKIYAEFLSLDVNKLLGLWRREYEAIFDKRNKGKRDIKKVKFIDTSGFTLTPRVVLTVIISFLVLVFFSYLFYQYRSYSGAPKLDIYNPKNNIVVHSEILDITGKTDRGSVLLINNQRVILDKDGSFVTSLKLKDGHNTFSILSINELGKETEEILTIIYREPIVEKAQNEDVESTEPTSEIPVEETTTP